MTSASDRSDAGATNQSPEIDEQRMHLIAAAESHVEQNAAAVALFDDAGVPTTYAELLQRSESLAREIAGVLEGQPLSTSVGTTRPRVVFLVEPSAAWVVTLWAIWRAGAIAVPLSPSHPPAELDYVISHCRPTLVVVGANLAGEFTAPSAAALVRIVVDETGRSLGESLLPGPGEAESDLDSAFSSESDAMILYTSGTTSRPKGVVTTHGNIGTQLRALTTAWDMSSDDHSLLALPLHHVHGIVNVLLCTLFVGGRVTLLRKFDANVVTHTLIGDAATTTVFMAVPTIYRRLLDLVDESDSKGGSVRTAFQKAGARIRLMVSGSAALPATVFSAWEALTGHALLERYGMTEIGMALSNPYLGERIPATVGVPLPHVSVRLVADGDQGRTVIDGDGEGEIEVAGPSVFRGYFENESATLEATSEDGWFKTGDRARRTGGRYSILGRLSVDILKSGGEKISALEIESVLLEHPQVSAVAVIGRPHRDWGDEVIAVIEPTSSGFDVEVLRAFAKERLAPFKVPRKFVEGILPRNALGKVQKAKLVAALD